MSNPTTVARVSAMAVGVAYGAALYAAGIKIDGSLKQLLTYLPVAFTFLIVAFDKWLWKIGLIKFMVPRPLVQGTWKGQLTPSAGSVVPDRRPRDCYVIIEQSFWSTSIRQYTAESRSASRASSLTHHHGSQAVTLSFTYENVPRQEFQDRGSNRHVGACELEITGKRPQELSGIYITDRLTKGQLDLRLHDRKTGHESFADARRHCDEATAPAEG